MLKIGDALEDLVSESNTLLFGLSHRLMNLSQLSEFLRPMVEARTHKSIQKSAVLMGLSRLQGKLELRVPEANVSIQQLSVRSNLRIMSFAKTPETHAQVHEVYTQITKDNHYFSLSESTTEITIIFDARYEDQVRSSISEVSKREYPPVASIAVNFPEQELEAPGALYQLVQKVTLQNINILEISSTYTELVFFVAEDQRRLAVETLENCF